MSQGLGSSIAAQLYLYSESLLHLCRPSSLDWGFEVWQSTAGKQIYKAENISVCPKVGLESHICFHGHARS